MWEIDFLGKIITLLVRTELVSPSEVPLANLSSEVTGLLHRFPNRDHLRRKGHGCSGVDDPFKWTPMTGNVRGDPDACLILSGLNCTKGVRANRSRRIVVSKAHAVLGQLIDVGRIDEIVSVTAEGSPSGVVDEYEDDLGADFLFCEHPVG